MKENLMSFLKGASLFGGGVFLTAEAIIGLAKLKHYLLPIIGQDQAYILVMSILMGIVGGVLFMGLDFERRKDLRKLEKDQQDYTAKIKKINEDREIKKIS